MCAAAAPPKNLRYNTQQTGTQPITQTKYTTLTAGCWYAIQALAEAGALGAIVVAARRFSTDSDTILAAVKQVCGVFIARVCFVCFACVACMFVLPVAWGALLN